MKNNKLAIIISIVTLILICIFMVIAIRNILQQGIIDGII